MALTNQFVDTTSAVPGNLVTMYYKTPSDSTQASAIIGGYYDIPNVDIDEGSHNGYGGGSREPLYGIAGTVAPSFSNTVKVADLGFLTICFGDGSGPFGLPSSDLYFGAKDTPAYNGFMDRIVNAFCNSVSLNLQNQSGAEVTAAVEFWGKTYAQGQTVMNPTLGTSSGQLQVYGTPLTNGHLTQFALAPAGTQTSFLDHWQSIQIGRQHNLERCCPQADGHYGFIKPHNQVDNFTCDLYAPRIKDSLAYVSGLPLWGDGTVNAIEITLTDGVKTLHWKAKYAVVSRRTMKGGDIGGEWDGTLELQPRGVTVLYS